MRTKTVKRYYCDHCKKAGCSAGHMKRHEASCTGNPNRICRMCGVQSRDWKVVTSVLVRIPVLALNDEVICDDWQRDTTEESFKAMEDSLDGCPACILAALRQSKSYRTGWDFKDALKDWWAERNNEAASLVYHH